MTIPADVTKVNFDASGDDPRAARAEFVTWADATNTLFAHARAAVFFANSYTVGEGVEINAAALRAKVTSGGGVGRDSNGLYFNLFGLPTIPSDVDPAADAIPVYDASGPLTAKVTVTNLLKAYKDLTQLTAVDSAADKVPIYDASAAALKWVLPSALGGGLLLGGTVDTGTGAASQQVTGLAAKSARHLFFMGSIYPATDGQTLSVKLLKSDGTVLATVATGSGTNAGGDVGWRIFGFAPQVADGTTNKKLWLSWWGNGGNSTAWGAGSDVSVVDQVQVVASSGNVYGNLHVLYTI